MMQHLEQLGADARRDLAASGDAPALEAWKARYLGPKGSLKAALGSMKDVPAPERPAYGARVNALKNELEQALTERQGALGVSAASAAPVGPSLDMTEPGVVFTQELGRQHILTRVQAELVEVFARLGFSVAQGPELEDDEHNFVRLNIPPDHPAREPIDNFYVDDPRTTTRPRMLRSQTSTVQVRVMEQAVAAGGGHLREAIKIIAPGRVYRPDAVDATHSFMFHQIEGLYIDRDVSMADLKTTLLQFARAYFGAAADLRLRPSFFPFTEPSAEVDLRTRLRPDLPERWMELGGCGMVHPHVLKGCGVDPQQWSGFAFGFGIERLAMGKYGIPDIRMLYENDLRFLRQL